MERVYLDVTIANIITVALMVLLGGLLIGAVSNLGKGYMQSRKGAAS